MRTQIVRAALRASGSQPRAVSRPAIARTFSSTTLVNKKKVKKVIEVEEEDDLFGEVTSSPTGVKAAKAPRDDAAARAKFVEGAAAWEARLDWDKVDAGKPPSLHAFRALTASASTKEEFDRLLALAQTYRDRVGSLGVSRGLLLAARASNARYPELALNGFLNRYASGLEFDLDSLYVLQRGLFDKLVRADREELIASAALEGAPEPKEDLLAPPEADDGKAQVIEQLDDPELARAKLTLLDRMSLLASLVSNVNKAEQDVLILSFLPAAYIRAFQLTDPANIADTRHARITQRTDELISYTAKAAEKTRELRKTFKQNELLPSVAARLTRNLTDMLDYLAKGKDETKIARLTPFLDRYMHAVGLETKVASLLKTR